MSVTDTPICPCDGDVAPLPANLPGLAQIAYRAGTFRDFRRALLTPLQNPPGSPPAEYALNAWRSSVTSDPAVPDLAVMMVEWWAYLCDVLTFYNERIANESYLGTTMLPESPGRLISLLGYRPRPAIGATGTLAALVTPGQTATLPARLQFQSKPGPGQAPQTFQLAQATAIGAPDVVVANPSPPNLLAPPDANGNSSLLLVGSVTALSAGGVLLLGARDASVTPSLATLAAAPSVRTIVGGKQTQLSVSISHLPSPPLSAANARLQSAAQTMGLWTVNGWGSPPSGAIELSGLARQIRPNDWIVITARSTTPQLVQVTATVDVLGDAGTGANASATSVSTAASGAPTPIPVLHTQLTVSPAPATTLSSSSTAVTVLFGWTDVGTLVDQPPGPWDGTQSALAAVAPATFANGNSLPIIIQDATGAGVFGTGTSAGDGNLQVAWPNTNTPLSPPLQPPLSVYYNLLPVTAGKTVSKEVLGTGDATVPGQSFTLAQSPVTYLASGSSYASTIALTVNGVPWTEVTSFYGQSATALVFTTSEDEQNDTHVHFGDGVNGARLPSGASVVATYCVGAGATTPPAGKLTVIGQAYPGLRSLQNPIAVGGGSDPDSPSLLKVDAPRSVLTFGRAVSIFDYQAIAALAEGVTLALAVWTWDASSDRAVVCVYVAGTGDVVGTVQTALAADGDPNRPVIVLAATPIYVQLTMNLIVTPGMDTSTIASAVQSALADPNAGLFAPANLQIAQPVFDSQIEAACMAVAGVIAIGEPAGANAPAVTFAIGPTSTAFPTVDPGPLHAPGAGSYYSLSAQNVQISTLANPYG